VETPAAEVAAMKIENSQNNIPCKQFQSNNPFNPSSVAKRVADEETMVKGSPGTMVVAVSVQV
jgi:hypothetical protein